MSGYVVAVEFEMNSAIACWRVFTILHLTIQNVWYGKCLDIIPSVTVYHHHHYHLQYHYTLSLTPIFHYYQYQLKKSHRTTPRLPSLPTTVFDLFGNWIFRGFQLFTKSQVCATDLIRRVYAPSSIPPVGSIVYSLRDPLSQFILLLGIKPYQTWLHSPV